MRNIGIFIILILGFALHTPVAAAVDDEWISVKSRNFQLAGNAGEAEMHRTAEKLEQFRSVFTQLFPDFKFNPPVPTFVIVFKDDTSFNNFKPLDKNGNVKTWVKGFFLPNNDVNHIVLTAEKNVQSDYTTIFHEYVHFLVDNTLGRTNIPPWFNEGLAEYYEQFEIEKGQKVTLGKVNKSHLALLQKNGLMPLEKFFAVNYYTLHSQPKEEVIAYYAQAWALTHFLFHGNKGARKQQFQQFSELVIKGKSPETAFFESFQIDYAAMESDLKKYIGQKKFEVSVKILNENAFNANSLQTSPLSKAEAKAFSGNLLLRSNRTAEAAVFLEESLRLDPKLSFANTSMGLVKFKENNFPEAKKYLETAIENDTKDYFAFFTYAYILSREGMTDFGFIAGYDAQFAETIRINLRKAIALNPAFAESYQLFAFVNVVRNESLDEGIEMINKALEIAPGSENYNLRKAELLMHKHDFAAARTVTQSILRTATEEKSKLYALNTLNLINNWEAQLKEIEENKQRPRKIEENSSKPLTEEEIQKLNAQAVLESLNQVLRIPSVNEKRVLGYLSKVECESNGISYTVKLDDQVVRFKSGTVENIYLRSFEANMVNFRFGCDLINNERFAVITFKPDGNSKTVNSGEVTAIEFVPKSFVFLDVSKIVTRTEF